jgi:cellulose biosynthesis protein BcsQ
MSVYIFWNNKGGTGKTSLIFQSILRYAELNEDRKILAIDACPQANFSELLLGGLVNRGSNNLYQLHSTQPRCSLGGYFQDRLPSPYALPNTIDFHNYISNPNQFHSLIPSNIDLVAGDQLLELQSNAILANTQIPGTNPWLKIIDWIKDLIDNVGSEYNTVFIDANPAFSIYTQIAISASDFLILPVMADDSSRRAIDNVFSLVYGLHIPPIYIPYNFHSRLEAEQRSLPLIHTFVKNRLTQYMGPASAYASVLRTIDNMLGSIWSNNQNIFKDTIANSICEIRDFQTTGVVAFAHAMPFSECRVTRYDIHGQRTQLRRDNIQNCQDAINDLVSRI